MRSTTSANTFGEDPGERGKIRDKKVSEQARKEKE
jgi:hypothetical protein